MNIAIYGAEFINKGAEAMILTVVDALSKNIDGSRYFIHLPKDYFDDAIRFGLVPVRRTSKDGSLFQRFYGKATSAILYCICNAVVDVGGYQFGDPWGLTRMKNIVKATSRHHRLGHPVIFMPQAWGPFTGSGWEKMLLNLLDTADLCFVRDTTSMQEVEKLIGKNHPKIYFAHDIAWCFKGDPLTVGKTILEQQGKLENQENTVCITPNYRVYERTAGEGKENQYIRFLASVADYLCRRHNCRVILLGHEFFKDSCYPDDRTLCDLISMCIDPSLDVTHIKGNLSAPQIKSIIGNCRLLLSSRYHALIAALSQGVPAIALGWSHKYRELMKVVGLDNYVLSLDKDEQEARQTIDSVFADYSKLQTIVLQNVIPLKQSAEKCINMTVQCIKNQRQGGTLRSI